MVEVKLNRTNDNPFFGMRSCLNLFHTATKGTPVSINQIQLAWSECDNREKKQMFFVMMFSIGDIVARQHNIFRGSKKDSGGNGQRENFKIFLDWIISNHYDQFKKFLFSRLFNEYTSFDMLLENRIRSKKKKVLSKRNRLEGPKYYINDLSEFVAGIIKSGNASDKYYLGKFLTRPRISKRSKHKVMLPETKSLMRQREHFLKIVSHKAELPYKQKKTHIEFTGYIQWRRQFIENIESIMFSEKKILELDKGEFMDWLNTQPSGARFRIRRRLLNDKDKPKEKWNKNYAEWFLEWENFKSKKQSEVRVTEEKVRQGVATEEEKENLTKLKKEAKVTTGADISFQNIFMDIVSGKQVDQLKIHSFMEKVNLPYNTLVFIDDSGSMNAMNYNRELNVSFSSFSFANFLATICLLKNPSDEGRSLIGYFSRQTRMFTTMESTSDRYINNLVRWDKKTINSEPLIKPELSLMDNYNRLMNFSRSVQTSFGTDIASIPDYIQAWAGHDPIKLEELRNFPVWTIISDNNWNNLPSPEASMNSFMAKCQKYFGFKPYIIAIDAAPTYGADVTRFEGIENFMAIPPNPAQIEQLLTNFKDMDIMDNFTPLQSLFRSNRYDLVKQNVL